MDAAADAVKDLRNEASEDPRLPLRRRYCLSGETTKGLRENALQAVRQEAMPRQLQTSVHSLSAQLLLRRVLLWCSMLIVMGGIAGAVLYSNWCLGIALTGAMIALASVRACRRLFVASLKIPGAKRAAVGGYFMSHSGSFSKGHIVLSNAVSIFSDATADSGS